MAKTLALTTRCTVAQHAGAPRLLVVQGTTVLAVSSTRVVLTFALHLLQAHIELIIQPFFTRTSKWSQINQIRTLREREVKQNVTVRPS